VNEPTIWHNCYSDNWNGVIVAEAFAHPAKFARGLIRRIYEHMRDSGYITPGDRVIDPFGGIAAGAVDAMSMGLHWYGCELEPRFVTLGNANIDKWHRDLAMLGDRVGGAYLLQGDSRYLASLFGGGMAATISSPPYSGADGEGKTTDRDNRRLAAIGREDLIKRLSTEFRGGKGYGMEVPGQLGTMRNGNFAAAVSSPPYSTGERGHPSLGSVNKDAWGHDGRDIAARRGLNAEYGSTSGQLADMSEGVFAAAVSSPPYADAVNGTGEGPGARHDPIHHNGDNAHKVSSANGYGATPGNLGNLSGDGFQAAVSSPPFGGEAQHTGGPMPTKHYDGRQAPRVSSGMVTGAAPYGETEGQLAQENGDTFWSAARAIVEQTYAALRPGGYAAWVTKDFVRKGQRVPFSDQWQALCAAVGFVPVERIAAMLVDDHGDQLDIFGGVTARRKERKSFFRRLAEKKGSPRIDHEDVIIMRKPGTE
jgi:hypothetical protein